MNEFYAKPVPRDRVRVEINLVGKRFSSDILVADLPDEILRFESFLNHDAERVAVLRGSYQGSEVVMRAAHRYATAGEVYEVLLAVLWGLAHGPLGQGWSVLNGLGGRIVMARPVQGRGWRLEIADPAE